MILYQNIRFDHSGSMPQLAVNDAVRHQLLDVTGPLVARRLHMYRFRRFNAPYRRKFNWIRVAHTLMHSDNHLHFYR